MGPALYQFIKYKADQNMFAASKIIEVNLQWKIKACHIHLHHDNSLLPPKALEENSVMQTI